MTRKFYEINELYIKRQEVEKITGAEYHVNHIIPLTNPNACGIHCPWNVQVLTEDENRVKKNKFDGTYNNESWGGSYSI